MYATTNTDSFSFIPDADFERLLSYAQTKLQVRSIPMQVRATTYLRLCCAAISKLRDNTNLVELSNEDDLMDSSFSDLLHRLCSYQNQWWKDCYVSDRGNLKSTNPKVDQLLQTFAYFVESFAIHQQPTSHYDDAYTAWAIAKNNASHPVQVKPLG